MYKSPRTIALDLEGVVAKSQEMVIQLFNASEGAIPAHNGMLRNYDMTQFLRYANGEHISREKLLELFAEAWKNPRRIMMVDDSIPTILDGLDSWKILIATTTVGNPDNVSKFFEMNSNFYRGSTARSRERNFGRSSCVKKTFLDIDRSDLGGLPRRRYPELASLF